MGMAQMVGPIVSDATFPKGPVVTTFEQDTEKATEAAFNDLVEQHSQMAYNIALRMLRNPADAEDAVQDRSSAASLGAPLSPPGE